MGIDNFKYDVNYFLHRCNIFLTLKDGFGGIIK